MLPNKVDTNEIGCTPSMIVVLVVMLVLIVAGFVLCSQLSHEMHDGRGFREIMEEQSDQ